MALKPIVQKRGGEQRPGKGFSIGELKKAGLNLKQALKMGIPADSRRRTIHEENVKALKDYISNLKASVKPKRRKPKSREVSQ